MPRIHSSRAHTSAFNLPDHLSAKRTPALIADDDQHFAEILESHEKKITDLHQRLDVLRRSPGGRGQAGVQRDAEIHKYSRQLQTMSRFGMDLCIGRIVRAGDDAPIYIGRTALADSDGRRLLIDWRAPAAEVFFAATHADPMGLVSRRRYRWSQGRIVDYWDEVFAPDQLEGHAALDDQSAFIASLAQNRSAQMQDVLGTIQADQDAIIRAPSQGTLVLDGGPGTGKTVVALHRAARLLYSDPRLTGGRGGGVLFIGPTQSYREYVDDVLPSLGEDTVQICTLRDLVQEGESAGEETDSEVARLKSSPQLIGSIGKAAASYRQPPTQGTHVETPWADMWISPDEWLEVFGGFDPGTPHNEAREQAWDPLLEILIDQIDEEEQVSVERLRRYLHQQGDLWQEFIGAWPLLKPDAVLAGLWSDPELLQRCAPDLSPDDVKMLQRDDPYAWTVSDLPLLDEARSLIGNPEQARIQHRRRVALEAEQEQMSHTVDNLISADDDGEGLVTMLRQEDLQPQLIDESGLPSLNPDSLTGPFGHIIVDEAQELTDTEWQMVLRRCPSRSLTLVGDRAQARRGFPETWQERLARVGVRSISLRRLSVNYRTPQEIMDQAAPVIRSVLPDANIPESIRSSGLPVVYGELGQRAKILEEWLQTNPQGTACVIGDPAFPARPRVSSLTSKEAKGLEFDLVILVDPQIPSAAVEDSVDRYVAMTRATQQLVILNR